MATYQSSAVQQLAFHALLLVIGLLTLVASIGDVFLLLAPLALLLLWGWGVPAARRGLAAAEFEVLGLAGKYGNDGRPGRGLTLERYLSSRATRWAVRKAEPTLSPTTGAAVLVAGITLSLPWVLVLGAMFGI